VGDLGPKCHSKNKSQNVSKITTISVIFLNLDIDWEVFENKLG
jgi:hypothetical protein